MGRRLPILLGILLGFFLADSARATPIRPGDILVAEVGGTLRWVAADGSSSLVILSTAELPGFSPRGVAIGAGGEVFVTDFGHGTLLRVASDGSSFAVVGGGLPAPAGVAVEAGGTFVVIEDALAPLHRIAADGSVSAVTAGVLTGEDVEVAADGSLLALSENTSEILKVASDGSSIAVVASAAFLVGAGDFAVAADGSFIVADTSGGRLVRIAPDGVTWSTIIGGLSSPEGVTIAPDGSFIVAEHGTGTPRRVAADGSTSSVLFSGLTGPDHIATVPFRVPEAPAALLLGTGVMTLRAATWIRRRRSARGPACRRAFPRHSEPALPCS